MDASTANFDWGDADALLMIGASESDADLYYATGFLAPDPFVFVWTPTERLLLVSDLEVDRARDQSKADRVLSATALERQLQGDSPKRPSRHAVIHRLLGDLGVHKARVPARFPLQAAEELRRLGLTLEVAAEPLFPQRQLKSDAEIAHLRQALEAAEGGMEAAIDAIRRAQVRDGVLFLDGEPLTSERVRRHIHRRLLDDDCSARHTIVAGGPQGCDPHQEGHGPLRAGQPIIIDIFPQSGRSQYFGDITRTVVKGPAPEAVARLFDTVRQGQALALGRIRAGIDGRTVHQAILDLFAEAGFATGEKDGYQQGFFHGTGHGLGLEIHEAPHIGTRPETLKAGHVVTVEPGLYYRGLGGVRLEDVVVVQEDGCLNLTSYPIFLEV